MSSFSSVQLFRLLCHLSLWLFFDKSILHFKVASAKNWVLLRRGTIKGLSYIQWVRWWIHKKILYIDQSVWKTTNKTYKLYNKRYRITNAWATVEVAQKSVGQEWLLLYYSFYRLSVIFFIHVLNLINVRAFTVVLIVYVHLPIFSIDYTCYHAYKLE